MPTINYVEALDDLAEECSKASEAKGFRDNNLGEMGQIIAALFLIADEAGEALEVFRNRYDDSEEDIFTHMTEMQEEDFTEELGDVIIRTLDLAGHLDLDIGTAVVAKLERNVTRPHKHGKRF